MAKYNEPKCRLCRRAGKKLFLKGDRCFSPKCPVDKKGAVPPGEHGQKRRSRMTDYKGQLVEKQKAKEIYGVLERQFRIYFKKALTKKGKTGETLLQILESRLDNIVYRLNFASSRSAARQMIRHGHFLVDNRKVTIPSYQVKKGQVITLSARAIKIPAVKKALADKKAAIPSWLQKKAVAGKMMGLPGRDEIGTEINEHLIVEYYSR